ncbi:hypothetical protein SCORR_v1c05700 [Spiroplasma corruscae]|uniref:Uncharacterized protein n=1 Tax=Spiroplasma corruscae TaxID=216934 RepID=A0A222EPD2_9MOLU|nr:2-hydroxycarboxylate transporter family protein [Spiroplasma corruscae]ASP28342.1 hypothetical protein SCORR_v1c05700 [Spiroplasma corruscae]
MYKFLTTEENEKYVSKKSNSLVIFEKKSKKLNAYKEKEYFKMEKNYQKCKLSFLNKREKLKNKLELSKKVLEEKYQSNKLNDINYNNYFSSLEEIYSKKLLNLDEDLDIMEQNYVLAKQDIEDGFQNSVNYNEKVYIRSIEKKFAKIDFKKQFKIEKSKIINKNTDKKEFKLRLLEIKRSIYENSNKEYIPFQLAFINWKQRKKENFELWKLKKQKQLIEMKHYSFKDWITLRIYTIPLYLLLIMVGVVVAAFITGIVTDKMIYAFSILLTLSIVFGVLFTKIPIWNKYLGGALIGCMIIGSLFVKFNVLPTEVETSIKVWFEEQDFVGFYISVLLVGAVILIPKKMIVKATGGFFAIIIIGTLGATVVGLLGMLATGLSMKEFLLNYWLPILCSGNGGGIQPIGEIAAQNGFNKKDWMSSALTVSTVASILSVIMAGILSAIGKVRPSLSGDGKLVKKDIHTTERKSEAKDRNIAVAVLIIGIIYIASDTLANKVFTKDMIGILIPNYAWMIVIGITLNILNIIPREIKKGISKVNIFISKQTTWLLMFAVGMVYINFDKFVNALSPTTLLLCLSFVVGASIFPLFAAKLFKFYGVESAIAGGLCMTAQGGAGAIMVLGTSNRMELMPWGQITCRIAGSVILILAGVFFSIYANEAVPVGLL